MTALSIVVASPSRIAGDQLVLLSEPSIGSKSESAQKHLDIRQDRSSKTMSSYKLLLVALPPLGIVQAWIQAGLSYQLHTSILLIPLGAYMNGCCITRRSRRFLFTSPFGLASAECNAWTIMARIAHSLS